MLLETKTKDDQDNSMFKQSILSYVLNFIRKQIIYFLFGEFTPFFP